MSVVGNIGLPFVQIGVWRAWDSPVRSGNLVRDYAMIRQMNDATLELAGEEEDLQAQLDAMEKRSKEAQQRLKGAKRGQKKNDKKHTAVEGKHDDLKAEVKFLKRVVEEMKEGVYRQPVLSTSKYYRLKLHESISDEFRYWESFTTIRLM
eukprot:gene962-1860_t